jgi:hypothetical protein
MIHRSNVGLDFAKGDCEQVYVERGIVVRPLKGLS